MIWTMCTTSIARVLLTSALLLALAGAPSATTIATTPVELTREYLARWQQQLAAIVAEEHLTQTITSSKESGDTVRTLVSDVLVVRSRENAWLMFRDVMSVNGVAVRDREQRFASLFSRPDVDVVTSASRIADESARFNAGALFRNTNTPLAPLVFLDPKYARNTQWKWRDARLEGRAVIELTFEQKKAPFAIHDTDGRPQPAEGRIWSEPATGRIVKAEFRLEDKVIRGEGIFSGLTRMTTSVTATYGPVRDVATWVPLQMNEQIDLRVVQPQLTPEGGSMNERLVGTAAYSNFRQFQTSGRIVGHTY